MGKTLVLYVYHIYNNRVQHFIDNAIFKDDNIDFIVISNNKDHKIVVPEYVKTLYRDNIGYDFGGWSDALLVDNLYNNYDHFIFANSSIMGPYLPSYYKGKWTDVYINGLNDTIKLFGSTINTCQKPLTLSHVQSYIFAMNKTTLEYLIKCDIFSMSNYAKTFNNAIWDKEVLMSRKLIENNWNIGSLLSCYRNIDFTFKNKKLEDYRLTFFDDIMYEPYRNKLWNEYELVFIKGNRVNIL